MSKQLMSNKADSKGVHSRQKIYNFLVDYITKNGYAPSMREICNGTGLSSTGSVYDHLKILEVVGKIEMKPNTPRAIKLVGYKFVKTEGLE